MAMQPGNGHAEFNKFLERLSVLLAETHGNAVSVSIVSETAAEDGIVGSTVNHLSFGFDGAKRLAVIGFHIAAMAESHGNFPEVRALRNAWRKIAPDGDYANITMGKN